MYSLVYTFSTYMPGVALLPSSNLLYLLNFFFSSSFVAFLLSFLQYWVYIPLDYKYLFFSLALTFIPHRSPLRYFSLISSSSPLFLFFHLFLLSFRIAVLFLSPLSFSLQRMEPRHSRRTLFSNVIEMKVNGVHRMNVASISMTFENKVLRLCLGSIRFKENERGDRKRTAIRKERRKRWKNKNRGDDDKMREKYRRGERWGINLRAREKKKYL